MYRAALAAYHAAHRTCLAREAATTLIDKLAADRLHRGLVADVGCGDGTLSALLSDSGYGVIAIDPSPAFLEIVEQRAPKAQRVRSTAAEMRLPTGLTAIACVGEVLSYDLQIDLDETLESFRTALRPGGLLLLDLPGPGRHENELVVREHDDSLLVMQLSESGYALQRHITLMTQEDTGCYRRTDEVHHLRLYVPADVRAALARAGFVAVRRLEQYGTSGPRFHDGWAGFLASRA
jgi:SAM-dependent methyltransferase